MNAAAAQLFKDLRSETRPKDMVRSMSGGQRQAVAIARTRLSDAEIVLMDEPTAAISVRQVAEVLNLIRELQRQGVAVVLISHRMPDVFAVADRIIVLRRGTKVADKPTADDLAAGDHRPDHRRDRTCLNRKGKRVCHMATSIDDAIERQTHTRLGRIVGQQAFWVFVAALLACLALSVLTDTFATPQNLFNVTRNFAFVGIMALGMTVVIISGGIDLSVGSVLCLSAMVLAITMNAGYPLWLRQPLRRLPLRCSSASSTAC